VSQPADLFLRLRRSIENLERAVSAERSTSQDERILRERTERIARQPQQVDAAPGAYSCLVFERCSGRYAVRLDALDDVGPLGPVAPVPGIPDAYLGVTARRGKVVAVVDLPRLFGSAADAGRPAWLIMTGDLACGLAADVLHDIIEIDSRKITRSMPTFPALVRTHTLGVLEDRTVVLDAQGLLADRSLRVEHRG
jgi:purine-binding chemotaxis protein CheW